MDLTESGFVTLAKIIEQGKQGLWILVIILCFLLSPRLVEKPTQFSNIFEFFLHACHTVNNTLIAIKLSEEFVHGQN